MHNTDKYVLILIYISAVKKNGTKIFYRIIREIYLISNLKAYILIENNIVDLE